MSERESQPLSEDGESLTESEDKAVKVPADAVVEYLNRISPGNKCSFCKKGEYGVIPGPAGGTAGVVATPVPHVQHLGVWFYIATCTRCGHTALFNTAFVLKAMTEERQ